MNVAPVLGALNDVFVVHDGRLVKFNTSLRKIGWEKNANFVGQPSVAKGGVYANASNCLHAFRESDGKQLWAWTRVHNNPSNIIVTDTHLFVCSSGSVHA